MAKKLTAVRAAFFAILFGYGSIAASAIGAQGRFIETDIDLSEYAGTGNIGQYGDYITRPDGVFRDLYLPRCTPPDGATILDFDLDAVGSSPDITGHDEIATIHGVVLRPAFGSISRENVVGLTAASGAVVDFDRPQRHVGLYIGANTGTFAQLDLTAFDAIGRVVGRDTIINVGKPINTCMAVGATGSAGIKNVVIEKRGSGQVMIDRLFFSDSVGLPALPRPVSGTVEFVTPQDRQTLRASRGQNVIGLIRIPTGMSLSEVTLSVPRWDRLTTETMFADFFRLRTEGGQDVYWFAKARVLIPEGPSWIAVTAVGPGVRATAGVEVIGVGAPAFAEGDLPGRVDIEPITMEVTQAIRGDVDLIPPGGSIRERSDNVLVHDKPTVVRAFARYFFPDLTPGSAPPAYVMAELHGSRDGAALPGSPILPYGPLRNAVMLSSDRAGAYHSAKQRTLGSWNFRLPSSWTAEGQIDLRLVVNPATRPAPMPEFPGTDGALNEITLRNVIFRGQQHPSVRAWAVDYWWRCPYTGGSGLSNGGRNAGVLCPMGSTDIVNMQPTDLEISTAVRNWWNMAPFPGIWPRTYGVFDYVFADAGSPPEPHLESGSTIDQFLLGSAFRCNLVSNHDYSRFNALISSFVRGCANGIPSAFRATATDDGTVLMHEAGHTMGLRHTSGAHGAAGAVTRWPGDHGEISRSETDSSAFNVRLMQALPYYLSTTRRANTERHDVMGYSGPADNPRQRWPSFAVWHHMEDVVGSNLVRVDNRVDDQYYGGQPAPGPEGAVSVAGEITPDGVKLRHGYVGAGGLLSEGDLVVEVLTADGKRLRHARSASARPYDVEDMKISSFVIPVEIDDEARMLVLYQNGKEIFRSPIEPAPELVVLKAPKKWPSKGKVTIAWAVKGGDAKEFRLEASRDGKEWFPLAVVRNQKQITLDAAALPFEGKGWVIRLQATNGIDVTLSNAIDAVFPVRPLKPIIVNPLSGDVLSANDAINLQATLSEFASADPSTLEWTYKGKVIAQGLTGAAYIGTPGEHVIGLRTPDKKYETTVKFTIISDEDADGIDDNWELQFGLKPTDPYDSEYDLDQDGLTTFDEYSIGTDPTEPDTDKDGYSDEVERNSGSDPLDAKSVPAKPEKESKQQQMKHGYR